VAVDANSVAAMLWGADHGPPSLGEACRSAAHSDLSLLASYTTPPNMGSSYTWLQ
jgi:hypothetical protein